MKQRPQNKPYSVKRARIQVYAFKYDRAHNANISMKRTNNAILKVCWGPAGEAGAFADAGSTSGRRFVHTGTTWQLGFHLGTNIRRTKKLKWAIEHAHIYKKPLKRHIEQKNHEIKCPIIFYCCGVMDGMAYG